MGCLSQAQLARLALGLAEDAELTTHLEQCAACRAGLEAMRSLRHELAEAHAKFDEGHEAARERLLAILPAANRPPEPARPWKQITHWIGGLTMRQRIAAFGGVGVAAHVGISLALGRDRHQVASAMEKMAENVRKAKSYKYTSIVQAGTGGKAAVREGYVYWLAPDWRGQGSDPTAVGRGRGRRW